MRVDATFGKAVQTLTKPVRVTCIDRPKTRG